MGDIINSKARFISSSSTRPQGNPRTWTGFVGYIYPPIDSQLDGPIYVMVLRAVITQSPSQSSQQRIEVEEYLTGSLTGRTFIIPPRSLNFMTEQDATLEPVAYLYRFMLIKPNQQAAWLGQVEKAEYDVDRTLSLFLKPRLGSTLKKIPWIATDGSLLTSSTTISGTFVPRSTFILGYLQGATNKPHHLFSWAQGFETRWATFVGRFEDLGKLQPTKAAPTIDSMLDRNLAIPLLDPRGSVSSVSPDELIINLSPTTNPVESKSRTSSLDSLDNVTRSLSAALNTVADDPDEAGPSTPVRVMFTESRNNLSHISPAQPNIQTPCQPPIYKESTINSLTLNGPQLERHQSIFRSDPLDNGKWSTLSIAGRGDYILGQQRLLNEFYLTKRSIRIIMAGDFGLEPLDYFYPRRLDSVLDSLQAPPLPTKWNTLEAPHKSVSTLEAWEGALRIVHEIGRKYYTTHIADAFGEIHHYAYLRTALHMSPTQVAIHRSLTEATLIKVLDSAASSTECSLRVLARQTLSPNSEEYIKLVQWPLESIQYAKPPVSHKPVTQQNAPGSKRIKYSDVEKLIPKIDGKDVCLMFQSAKGCYLNDKCIRVHQTRPLTGKLKDYVLQQHGSIA
jgi:hypothetical protein